MSDRVLLVIPCFRESGRIEPFLDSLFDELGGITTVSVMVVDDGSGVPEQERMRSIVDKRRARWPGLKPLVVLDKNLGKGGAIYAGWATSGSCEWFAFVDADGSCPAYEVGRLIRMATQQPGTALFASRVCMLGKRIQRDFHRHLIGRVYATIVSEMLQIHVYDSQCGLKLLPAAAFERVRPLLRVFGFAFDVELLCALLDSGVLVHEAPIDWHETGGGKVRLVRDSLRMFCDVLAIRRRRNSKQWMAFCALARPGSPSPGQRL